MGKDFYCGIRADGWERQQITHLATAYGRTESDIVDGRLGIIELVGFTSAGVKISVPNLSVWVMARWVNSEPDKPVGNPR